MVFFFVLSILLENILKLHCLKKSRTITSIEKNSMYFSKKMTKSSLANIGAHCGGKDHATVLHACRTVVNLSETDKQFRNYLEELEKKLTIH